MNIIKFFKDSPLGTLPSVAHYVTGTVFEHKSLEEIRNDPDLYYNFISFVVAKINE